jgi:hypothetical protein
MKSDPKRIGRRPKIRGPSEKVNFTRHLVGVLRDIEDNQSWKYDELSPVQLLERLKLDKRLADRDELERAEYFWTRGRVSSVRSVGLLGFFWLLGCHFGYSLSRP